MIPPVLPLSLTPTSSHLSLSVSRPLSPFFEVSALTCCLSRPDDRMARNDWRTQFLPEARQRIVYKLMEILKRHLPISVPEGLNELQKIAILFEEKIYTAAANQSDYLRIISLKMLAMENKSHNSASINPSMSNGAVINQNPADPGLSGSYSKAGPFALRRSRRISKPPKRYGFDSPTFP